MTTPSVPFRFKWAGGKRWLAKALVSSLGTDVFRAGLCEPFAGGAALSFAINGVGPLHLADTNNDLMETYRIIRGSPAELAASLAELKVTPQMFQDLRAQTPITSIQLATRTIYLNRTAFGGLWRVNALGQFNVPYGCKPETRLPTLDELAATASVLKDASLEVADFQVTAFSTSASTVYFDPPYTVSHNDNGFLRYNEQIFSWQDQQRLAETATTLAESGRKVILSNALHRDIRRLYRTGSFKLYRVSRVTNLAALGDRRGVTHELLAISRNITVRTLPSFAVRIS